MSSFRQPSLKRRPRRILTPVLVLSLFLLTALPALAAPTDSLSGLDYTEPTVPSTFLGFFYTLFRLAVSMAVVIGLFFGAVWLYRRFSWSGNAAKPPSQDAMRVIGGVSLGNGRFVQMLQVGERVMLLGSADGGVSNIGELEPEDAAKFIELYEAKGLESMEPFEATLFRLYAGWQDSETRKTSKGVKAWIGGARDAVDNIRQKTIRR